MIRRQGPVVAVVGAGITGMAAAWELVTGEWAEGRRPEVHVLDSAPRTGGRLESAEFAGRVVDVAADAFVARRPEATELCTELGLADELVPPGANGAGVWARDRVRRMPRGLNLGVPTRWWPLARSGILGAAEAAAVARDLVTPRFGPRGVGGDRAVGAIVGERLGRPVVERLVDPLVGGINAGDVDELSAAAAFPFLLAASLQPGSLMRRMRTRPGSRTPTARGAASSSASEQGAPVFWSLPGGTARLAGRLSSELERRGVTIRTGAMLSAITRRSGEHNGSGGWHLDMRSGNSDRLDHIEADAVVLATPARSSAALLADLAPEAAGLLRSIQYASVAVATISLPPGSIRGPLHGTGLLVPRTTQFDGKRPLVTAVTYLDRKWPHLARDGDQLVRASVGRFGDERHRSLDDDELRLAVLEDLGRLLGVGAPPLDSMIVRFDDSFPQYGVGHLIRVARIEQCAAQLGGVEVAGASYRGVGIPACIAGGREAARRLFRFLRPVASAVGPIGLEQPDPGR